MAEAEPKSVRKKRPSRAARSVRVIVGLIVLAGALAGLNAYTYKQDVQAATGSPQPAQQGFFVTAADRPDIEVFFKSLTHEQRVAMGKNLGAHNAPKVAELAARLMNSFDAEARAELERSLILLAPKQPEAVADQLKLGASFQRIGVFKALDTLGPAAIPLAVARLEKADCRTNAASYLLMKGAPVCEPTLALLASSKEKDARLAAADVLAKLRYLPAAPALAKLLTQAREETLAETDPTKVPDKRAEALGYLGALATVAAPESEALLRTTAKDEATPGPYRAQSLLGLGRIGNAACQATLWEFALQQDRLLSDAAYSGLQLVGDDVLKSDRPLSSLLKVAAGLVSRAADAVVARALTSPAIALEAATSAADRPGLVPALVARLQAIDASTEGALADRIIESLASTPAGQRSLQGLRKDPGIEALARRRLTQN